MKVNFTKLLLLVGLMFGLSNVQAQFTLLTPPDSASVDLNSGALTDSAVISWSLLDSSATYNFHLDTLGGSFAPPLFTSDTLSDTVLYLTFGTLDTLLGSLGVAEGDSIDLLWTVTANVDSGTVFADTIFFISFTRLVATSVNPAEVVEFKLYPNPASDYLVFESELSHEVSAVSIFDLAGKKVATHELTPRSGFVSENISISQLKPGMYIFSLEGKGVNASKMFRVE